MKTIMNFIKKIIRWIFGSPEKTTRTPGIGGGRDEINRQE